MLLFQLVSPHAAVLFQADESLLCLSLAEVTPRSEAGQLHLRHFRPDSAVIIGVITGTRTLQVVL